MRDCNYGTELKNGKVYCKNTVDLIHNGLVPLEVCNVCPYIKPRVKQNFFEQTKDLLVIKQKLGEIVVIQRECNCPNTDTLIKLKEGIRQKKQTIVKRRTSIKKHTPMPVPKPKDNEWCCVVTTSPRQIPTVTQCVESIIKAGWTPTVFAEPDSIVVPGVKYVNNETRQGAFHNWLNSIKYALTKSDVKYILSVQDDSLFHPDSREFTESIMFPSDDTGFISLYTAKHYSTDWSENLKPTGVNRITTSSLWGACALVFERSVLQQVVDHPLTEIWTGIPPANATEEERHHVLQAKKEHPYLIQNVDTLIGKIMNSLHLGMYFIDPSPVEHIAVVSSIGHGSNTGKRNCLRKADFNKPLKEQVPLT